MFTNKVSRIISSEAASSSRSSTQNQRRRGVKLAILLAVIVACILYNNYAVVSPSVFLVTHQYQHQQQQQQQQHQNQRSSSSSSTIDDNDYSSNQQHQKRRQVQATTRTRKRKALSRPEAAGAELQGEVPVVVDHDDTQRKATPQKEAIAVPSSPQSPSTKKRPVKFINTDDLDLMLDVFAASWWESKERFLEANLTLIKNVEGDVFIPIRSAGNGYDDARMTVDWLDFSVEHLSKWWKMLDAKGGNYATGLLQSYVLSASRSPLSTTLMQSTLAVVPYGVQSHSHIWQASLTATLASLIKQGVGRVVVVGYYEADEILTHSAFQYLSQTYDGGRFKRKKSDEHYFSMQVASTTLVFVHTDDVKSKFIATNIPRGALIGIKDALLGKRPDASNWVGKIPSKWKYIFLTEADQILNARLSPEFFTAMEEGRIVIPHRIQPIPHWLDLESMYIESGEKSPHHPVPMVTSNVSQKVFHLNPETDSCCDAGLGSKLKIPEEKLCGGFWWQCPVDNPSHMDFLRKYQFMRISTGVVHLAASEHSRKCIPIRGSEGCLPASS